MHIHVYSIDVYYTVEYSGSTGMGCLGTGYGQTVQDHLLLTLAQL
jgi:hypothetical protein